MKLGHAFLAIAAVVVLATGARADSIPASSYAINGSLTIPGNGASSEIIDFAFTLDYFAIGSYAGGPVYGYDTQIVGPVLVAASGPLGLFGSSAPEFRADTGPGPSSGYLPFFNSAAPSVNASNVGNFDEIDLVMDDVDVSVGAVNPGPPTSADASMYRCQTATCMADFLLPGEATVGPLGPGGTAQFTATSIAVDPPGVDPPGVDPPAVDPPVNTPEPGTMLLTLMGLGVMAIAAKNKKGPQAMV
jgi:hypothetical protein